jgi:hypothetical protein
MYPELNKVIKEGGCILEKSESTMAIDLNVAIRYCWEEAGKELKLIRKLLEK